MACFPIAPRAVVWFYHNGAPYFPKGAHHGLCPLSDSDATLGPCISSGSPLCEYSCPLTREALIKSLFAFILEFLCNARNGLTRIASYLRRPMTKQCIKILIKENSIN